ncbi:MAG: fumarate hydratase [Candidatus Muiribacteriota bacterium]
MNYSKFEKEIYNNLYNKLISANTVLSEDYIVFLKNIVKQSKSSKERFYIRKILKNSEIASKKGWALCQDTGFVNFFIEYPQNLKNIIEIKEICIKALKDSYKDKKFRKSMLDTEGKNTENNLPPFFHFNPVKTNWLKISFLIKGGGSENVSGVLNLLPGSDENEIINHINHFFIEKVKAKACPPYFLGIGIGGNIEKACLNSKLALLKYSFDKENNFENKIKNKINKNQTGIFGTGYGNTVFGIKIIKAPSHIANNIVALSFNCHSLRRGKYETEFLCM